MAEKNADSFTLVSDLVGRIGFDVSGEGIPSTTGFQIEVHYADGAQKMKAALDTTRVRVQTIVRNYYRKNGKFPFKPGMLQKVGGDGEFTLPATVHMDKLEQQARAGALDTDDIARLRALLASAEAALGNSVAQASTSTSMMEPTQLVPVVDPVVEPEYQLKYKTEWLERQSVNRLRIEAAGCNIDAHATMSKEQLVEALEEVYA